MGVYTIDNALREKWSSRQTAEAENFDWENVDELTKIHQYFPPSKFYAIRYKLFKDSFNWVKQEGLLSGCL